MAHESIVEQARQWIDRVDAGRGLSNNWRLQVIQKKYRKRDKSADTGTGLDCDSDSCNGMPLRIRRFVPGCPWALVDQAIRYLICKAPYTGLIYNGLEIPGTYRPTLTMWQRDEQSTVDEANPKNGTYTLIQDLIQEDCDDEETVVTGESCSYTETTEYHWDSDSPGELPGCGSECDGTASCQGKTYAIQTRRNEDGTFDWQLVTRVTKTQHFGPYLIECNDCTRKVTREEWKGLYGNATDGFHSDCSDTPIAIPTCDTESGVHTQVQIEQAQDCTFNVTITRAESIEWTDTWTDGTSCRKRTIVDAHNLRSLPSTPRPAVGETIRVSLKRNDDCTYDYQRETTAAPEPLKYGWEDGNACRPREVTVYKNQTSQPSVPAIGKCETLDANISRNDDCTWDATFSVRKPATEAKIEWDQGSTCRPEHVISYQNSANLPTVPTAKRGQVVNASLRRNDDCTYDGQITVRDGLSKETLKWKQGSKCHVQNVTRILNATEVPTVPAAGAGQTVQASISRNEDCTYDAQITVDEPATPEHIKWTEGSSCKTVDAHHLINQTSYSVPKPSKGQTVQASVSKNNDCTYDVSYKITQPYSGDEITWTDGTTCKPRHHTLWIDQAEKPTIVSGTNGQVVDARLSFDPSNCTWSGQQTVQDKYQGSNTFTWTDGLSCQQTTNTLYVNSPTMPAIPSAPKGGRVDANISFNDSDCTWGGKVSVTSPATSECLTWTEGSCCESTTTTVCTHQTSAPSPGVGACGTKTSAVVTRNGDCTYDSRVSVTTGAERKDTYEWDSTEKTPGGMTAKYKNGMTVFKNLKEIPKVSKGHSNVRVSFGVNDLCLYDGTISWSDLDSWEKPDDGGLRTGLIKITTPIPASGGRTVYEHRTYKTIAFLGSGNDGTEAAYIMNGYVPMGGHGSVRVYRNSVAETYNINNVAT